MPAYAKHCFDHTSVYRRLWLNTCSQYNVYLKSHAKDLQCNLNKTQPGSWSRIRWRLRMKQWTLLWTFDLLLVCNQSQGWQMVFLKNTGLAKFQGSHSLVFWAVLCVSQYRYFHKPFGISISQSKNSNSLALSLKNTSLTISHFQQKTLVSPSCKVSNLPFAFPNPEIERLKNNDKDVVAMLVEQTIEVN